jgi:hypothetical protein
MISMRLRPFPALDVGGARGAGGAALHIPFFIKSGRFPARVRNKSEIKRTKISKVWTAVIRVLSRFVCFCTLSVYVKA